MQRRALFLIPATIIACGISNLAAQTPTFRTGIDLATFGVTVVDRKGEYLTNLTLDDFEVLEDGQKQTIKYFARGTDIENGPEIHVGLLFDTSGSMTEDIKLSRSAAVKFLNTLSDAKDMTLVDFDTEVRVAKYGQKDFPRMVERIRGRTPDGETALYDAMGVYLDGASEDEGRKILVLYTDGGDTHSTISFGDLMTLIRASDVTVYSVGFLEHSAGRIEERAHLMQIAEATAARRSFRRR
jgi:Ca-activated chloride channel family protein